MKTLLNVALFQIGWFASVLGAAHDRLYPGPLVVGVALALHLRFFGTRREGWLILASALLGLVAESALGLTQLVSYAADPAPAWLCPPWIVAMWANFGLTLRHSLSGLERRPYLATALGAVAGPLAYAGGAELGAIVLHDLVRASLFISVLWGFGLATLSRVSWRLLI